MDLITNRIVSPLPSHGWEERNPTHSPSLYTIPNRPAVIAPTITAAMEMECMVAVMAVMEVMGVMAGVMEADTETDMAVATTSTIMTSLRKWVFWALRLDWDTV